jgi:hypothetical protein
MQGGVCDLESEEQLRDKRRPLPLSLPCLCLLLSCTSPKGPLTDTLLSYYLDYKYSLKMIYRFFLSGLILAIYTSAIYIPPIMQKPKCQIDPAKQLGGPGYHWMWQGARGINSWTDGHGKNNALWDADQKGFILDTGNGVTLNTLWLIRVTNPGMANHSYGFITEPGGSCAAYIPRDVLTDKTKFLLAAYT